MIHLSAETSKSRETQRTSRLFPAQPHRHVSRPAACWPESTPKPDVSVRTGPDHRVHPGDQSESRTVANIENICVWEIPTLTVQTFSEAKQYFGCNLDKMVRSKIKLSFDLYSFWMFQYFKGRIFINEANVTYSDEVSVNGILHEINRFLFPPGVDGKLEPDLKVSTQHCCWSIYWLVCH